jgi:Na+/melibiose symporter-like transporter
MKRIETHRPRAPWLWVFPMAFLWLPQTYSDWCSGTPLLFTIRKFSEDPTTIALLSSINLAFNFFVGAFTNYMSDRIWTRWGRRRPFLIVGWVGLALAMFLIPNAPNIWALAAVIVFYQFCMDFAKPYEALYNEVIPPLQRGRASVLRNVLLNIAALFFNGMLIAQFDREYDLSAFGRALHLNGEMLVYWIGGGAVLVAAVFLVFFVRETPPLGGIVRERFSFRRFFRDVFCHREWWLIYLLYICPTLAAAGIPSFAALFYTDQLGFTKAQVGQIGMLALLVNIVVFVPLAGFLADKVDRMRIFQIGLLAPVALNLVFFLYARFVADYSVSYGTLLFFMTVAGTGGFVSFAWVVHGPLLYDYMPSNQYGTISAGFGFVQGLLSFVFLNAMGLWVRGFTSVFGSGGGSRTDWSSAYVFQFMGGVLAFMAAGYFAREVRRGRVKPYAQMEMDEMRKRRMAGSTP